MSAYFWLYTSACVLMMTIIPACIWCKEKGGCDENSFERRRQPFWFFTFASINLLIYNVFWYSQFLLQSTDGVMVSVLGSNVVDREFYPRSSQTKNYKFGMFCFSAKHATLRRDRRCRCDYTRNYDFVSRPCRQCHCAPSEEDCSCYIRSCPSGYILAQGKLNNK
jgi:hypothetical protein